MGNFFDAPIRWGFALVPQGLSGFSETAPFDTSSFFGNNTIKTEENDRAQDGGNESGRFTFRIPPHEAAIKTSEHGPRNAKQKRYNRATRIAARHEQLRHNSYQQANEDHPNHSH